MKKIKIVCILFFGLFFVYVSVNFVVSYINLSPKINKVFGDLENLEYNQQLTDSLIRLKEIKDGNTISINLKKADTLILCFVDCNDDFFNYSQKLSNKEGIKMKDYKKYIILNKKNCNVEYEKTYLLDGDLPLKYKKIVYPYSLKICKGEILSSKFNFLGNE